MQRPGYLSEYRGFLPKNFGEEKPAAKPASGGSIDAEIAAMEAELKKLEAQLPADATTAAIKKELKELEAEKAAVETIAIATPEGIVTAAAPAYTGGAPPTVGRRRAKVLTSEEKVEELVSQWETKKAMERALKPSKPIEIPTDLPKEIPLPAKEVAIPKLEAKLPAEPEVPKAGGIRGLFQRIRQALFGSPEETETTLEGFSETKTNNALNMIIAVVVIIGIYNFLSKRNEPSIQT
jgi:hypothetical protein